MKIKTNARAGRCAALDTTNTRCGGATRCGGSTRCSGGCNYAV